MPVVVLSFFFSECCCPRVDAGRGLNTGTWGPGAHMRIIIIVGDETSVLNNNDSCPGLALWHAFLALLLSQSFC